MLHLVGCTFEINDYICCDVRPSINFQNPTAGHPDDLGSIFFRNVENKFITLCKNL